MSYLRSLMTLLFAALAFTLTGGTAQASSDPIATAAGRCANPVQSWPTNDQWQPEATSPLIQQALGNVMYVLNGNENVPHGPNGKVYIRRKYSVCTPTQIQTDCLGYWITALRPQWPVATLDSLVAQIPKNAVLRYGRYRLEWISCRYSAPSNNDPATVKVERDLLAPDFSHQPATGGLDVPRVKAYYKLGFHDRVAGIREGRRWMVRAWLEYKKSHQDLCRHRSFPIPKRLSIFDGTPARLVGITAGGTKIVVTSNNEFAIYSRHRGRIVPC